MPLAALVRPDGYVPLTDRFLPHSAAGRAAIIGAFAALPFVHLLVVAGLDPNGWGAAVAEGLPSRFVNAYLIVLSFWGARHVAVRLVGVCRLTHDHGPRATWLTWLLPPVVLDVILGLATEGSRIGALPSGVAAGDGPIVVLSFGLVILVRLPQMAAFWTVVVALLTTARIDPERLPARYPDDRSLGMRPVGELVVVIFLLFSAAFVPVFLVSDISAVAFMPTIGLFLLGIAAMILGVWQIHRRMAHERTQQVDAATARFAAAYRAAVASEGAPTAKALEAASARLSTAEALLRGAESIHEWPFDERMQRIVAIVMTGVITGLIIRAILLPFGS
jgi:hypothetical protein